MDPVTNQDTRKSFDEGDPIEHIEQDTGTECGCGKNCGVEFNTWAKLLETSRKKMDLVNRKLSVNTLLYKEIERTMMEFRRLHRKFGNSLTNEQMQHLAAVLETCLTRLERVAWNSAEYTHSIYHIRKNLGILEDRIVGEQKDSTDPLRIALECMMKRCEDDDSLEQTSHD